MRDELYKWHKYRDLLQLYEANKMGLDDLWDEDWAVIAHMMRCKSQYKQEKSEEAERIKNLLGNRTGALR